MHCGRTPIPRLNCTALHYKYCTAFPCDRQSVHVIRLVGSGRQEGEATKAKKLEATNFLLDCRMSTAKFVVFYDAHNSIKAIHQLRKAVLLKGIGQHTPSYS